MEIDKKMINEAMKKMNISDSVKELYEIKKEVRDVYDNQAQIIPALITVWDRLEYNTKLLHKILIHNKLPFDNPPTQKQDMSLD
jgi:ACT domain-containing protein